MFDKVLIPFDLSDRSVPAFAALRAAVAPGASLELFHVVEQATEEPDPEFNSFYRVLERKARAKAEPWCEMLSREGFSVQLQICVGRRGAEILRRARETKCNLIVIASHAITGLDSRLGTVSHQIALLAPCSVLLVR